MCYWQVVIGRCRSTVNSMSRSRMPIILFAGSFVLSICGCVFEGPSSVRRVWCDYNTLKTPAIYYEKIHHAPQRSHRVKQMRWMYGYVPWSPEMFPAGAISSPTVSEPSGELLPVPSPPISSPQQQPVPVPTEQPVPSPQSKRMKVKSPRTANNGSWRFLR